jgi:hypothetical protein
MRIHEIDFGDGPFEGDGFVPIELGSERVMGECGYRAEQQAPRQKGNNFH